MKNFSYYLIMIVAAVLISCAGSDKSKNEKGELQTITTPSGLKYIDLTEGSGAAPQNGQTVVVHYVGTLENGQEFDSSRKRNQPFSFILGSGKVIKGWDEGLLGMKIGGMRKLIIPPDLGYGSRNVGTIPANSTLIFEVELLDIR